MRKKVLKALGILFAALTLALIGGLLGRWLFGPELPTWNLDYLPWAR